MSDSKELATQIHVWYQEFLPSMREKFPSLSDVLINKIIAKEFLKQFIKAKSSSKEEISQNLEQQLSLVQLN